MLSKRLLVTTALTVTALLCAFGIASLPAAASTTAAAGTTSASNVPNPGGPVVRAKVSGNSSLPTISLNWSGYAAVSSKKFTYVNVRFVQPAITCPGVANQWTSNWAGLDGFTNGTVEQDGTFAHCGGPGNTTPKYEAWYEMFPAGSVSVFPVRAGDTINASVSYANGLFTLTISDLTTGYSNTHTAPCADCQRTSAEWIIERPALCNNTETKCFLTELANFGTTIMSQSRAAVAGGPVRGVGSFTNIPIYMVNPLKSGGFISLDTVSGLSGQAFEAVWDRSGTIYPIQL